MSGLKCGRRPAKAAPALDFTRLLITGTPVPVVPATEDYLAALDGGWLMLGNDAAGDCEAVRWANDRRLTSTTLGTAAYPSQADVWTVYKTQNPNFVPGSGPHGYGSADDQGMDTQTLLEYLVKTGGPDGVKAVCFGKIDPTNVPAVEAAIGVFGGVWVDILVLDDNQTQFSQGVPWTNTGGAVDGGHAVLAGGYVPQRKFITWAAETEFADSFWTGTCPDGPLVESVWVVVWPEHLGTKSFLTGVNTTQLAADFTALTGAKFPALPTPAPTPSPTPVPPTPGAAPFPGALPTVAARVDSAAARAKLAPPDWLNKHFTSYFGLS